MSGFSDIRKRTARKPYRCEDCSQPINPGDRYYASSGLQDGDWWSRRTCLICQLLVEHYDEPSDENLITLDCWDGQPAAIAIVERVLSKHPEIGTAPFWRQKIGVQ